MLRNVKGNERLEERRSVEIVYRTPQVMGQKRIRGAKATPGLSPCDWETGDVIPRMASRRRS